MHQMTRERSTYNNLNSSSINHKLLIGRSNEYDSLISTFFSSFIMFIFFRCFRSHGLLPIYCSLMFCKGMPNQLRDRTLIWSGGFWALSWNQVHHCGWIPQSIHLRIDSFSSVFQRSCFVGWKSIILWNNLLVGHVTSQMIGSACKCVVTCWTF